MFTKKHYNKIAEVIKKIPDESIRRNVAFNFADVFTQDNRRFDWDLFITKCGANDSSN